MTRLTKFCYLPSCSQTASSPSQYILNIRQQPVQARLSTNSERERKPIEPAPIIQINLANSSLQETDNLCHPTDDEEIYTPTHNALSGQTVSSMYRLSDIDDQSNAFFIFGDLSVKIEGKYRLKFSLFQITETGAVCLSSVFSHPFTVYPIKNFPGTLDSTFLSKSFSDQGARIKIRKDNHSQSTANLRKRKQTNHSVTLSLNNICTERRNSMTSHDTHSSAEESPIMVSPSLPCLHTVLPSLSTSTLEKDSYDCHQPPLYSSLFDEPALRLPPLQGTFKRTKTTHEQDAVVAMMQLSQTHYIFPTTTI
ncbi:hypothetical protein G6F46_011304 [Rhizopus delemar]|nr:hypothetical protein G6F55_010776 [Rhizopus delemar]KAG1535645.1 hypothetical protein G6F51_011425 [Rhizopus arrhizus]KAG1491116.1 hypothetical protein G6F54_010247 [Rhizopus delemar]KAG1509109.1 hypothetical protein G6F53_007689 [Rhizopus delemar]KAG1517896.1 hypothetical protein G6F52_009141 [Rhizopus delemar]